jgi:D-3-phosphoglycerate dehydrogenase / 2-oxoglutarate reductase
MSILNLGIVGYGHIGSQLSVLAESMGMSVIYYDVFPIMVSPQYSKN